MEYLPCMPLRLHYELVPESAYACIFCVFEFSDCIRMVDCTKLWFLRVHRGRYFLDSNVTVVFSNCVTLYIEWFQWKDRRTNWLLNPASRMCRVKSPPCVLVHLTTSCLSIAAVWWLYGTTSLLDLKDHWSLWSSDSAQWLHQAPAASTTHYLFSCFEWQ